MQGTAASPDQANISLPVGAQFEEGQVMHPIITQGKVQGSGKQHHGAAQRPLLVDH